ncbi:MAG TPA: glycosyl hydrolase family 18 protein [Actinocatenispora sp.]
MHRPIKALGAAVVGLLVAGATATAAYAAHAPDTAASPALATNWYAAAPYLMPADNNPPDPGEIMDATGQKAFQLAFILSDGGCNPAWDGRTPLDQAASIDAAIATIRGKGGDVSVSVGGYNGTKLGQVCGDAASTAAAYQKVVSKYGLHAIDFDLEEPEYENTAAIANELGAAKILQQNNSGLYVSVTMPGTSAGTGWFGTQLLDQAKAIGFTPSNYSIMPFDGGFGGGGASQTAALEAFHGLLMQHLGWDSDFAYQHEGVSGMNGRTDAAEYFRQADFQTVLNYALSHRLGRYTYWSANRDRECNPPENQQLSGECSSVAQQKWEFTTYTTAFANQTTVVDPPTTPPGGGGNPGTCPAKTWDASVAYVGGDTVTYGGHGWTAKWWTQGDVPGNNGQDVWTDNGACTAATATTTGASYETVAAHADASACPAAWDSTKAYVGGETASYGGHAWTAKWWTQGDVPGNNGQDVWTDNGACGGTGTTPPAAPTGLTQKAVTATSVSLGWTAPSGAVDSYNVYRDGTKVASSTTTTATVGGLSASTGYSFQVSAVNAAGESPKSDALAVTTAVGGGSDGGKSGYINGSGAGNKRIIYFDQWSIYQNAYYLRDLDKYADNIDVINYDFENIEPNNLTCFETTKATAPDPGGETDPNAGDGAGDQFADYEKTFDAASSVDGQADAWGQPIAGNFNQIKKLKARHPNLKVILSLGGWTYSKYFSDAAATSASRQKLVSSCLDMFVRGNLPTSPGGYGGAGTAKGLFDGIDIDWEYPGSDAGHVGNHYSADDTANFTALLAEFRSELDAQGTADGKKYLLTAALPGGQDKLSKVQTDKIGQYLDYGNAMTYDMHGAWDATGPTNLQDPLFPSADDPSTPVPGGTQQYDADTILKAYTVGDPMYGIPGGFPADKLTIGIPMYYRGWTGVPAGSTNGEYGSATGPSAPQALSGNVPGVALQKELASLGFYPGKEYYDPVRMAGWYYDGSTFYAGSTQASIVDHVAYAKCNGLGGMMIFSAYDETPSSQPLLEKILSEAGKGKPADCSKYATDTWGTYGPPTVAANAPKAAPADGGADRGAGSYAPPAAVTGPRDIRAGNRN